MDKKPDILHDSKEDLAATYLQVGIYLDSWGGHKPEEIIYYYEKAIGLNPGYAFAYFNLGIFLNKIGDWPGVIEQAEILRQLNEDTYAQALLNLP